VSAVLTEAQALNPSATETDKRVLFRAFIIILSEEVSGYDNEYLGRLKRQVGFQTA